MRHCQVAQPEISSEKINQWSTSRTSSTFWSATIEVCAEGLPIDGTTPWQTALA
jgi:hypothetical protein